MFKSINKIIKIFIVSDFFFNCGWGLLGPIFSIFIVQNITTGSITEGAKVAGFAALFYWITKSILHIPIGRYLDKNHGEKDDFWFVFFGTFLTGLVPFGFLISSLPWHIYIFQILHGIGMAMCLPSWLAIFTRHIDKGKEAFEWGMESTSIGIGAGLTGAVGGIMVAFFSFKIVFILVGAFTIFSTLLILIVRKEMVSKTPVEHRVFPSWPF